MTSCVHSPPPGCLPQARHLHQQNRGEQQNVSPNPASSRSYSTSFCHGSGAQPPPWMSLRSLPCSSICSRLTVVFSLLIRIEHEHRSFFPCMSSTTSSSQWLPRR